MILYELRYVSEWARKTSGAQLAVIHTLAAPQGAWAGSIYLGFDSAAEAIAHAQSVRLKAGEHVRVEMPDGFRTYERHAAADEPPGWKR